MKLLIIGGNSYLARSFVKRCGPGIDCTLLHRDESFRDYFDLDAESLSGYDAILNCAAIVHNSRPDPVLSHRINAELPYHLARLAKSAGAAQFVHISTLAVYGTASHIDASSPESPNTLYGKSKCEGDRRLLTLSDDSFRIAIVRPPIVYGPNAPGNFNRLVTLIRRFPILPFGYDRNRRAMIYIGNLVNAMEFILLQREIGVFLLRDGLMLSLHDLCRHISRELGLKRLFFTLPEWMITLSRRCTFLPFNQLYGTLEVDDSLTRQKIGDYAAVSFARALHLTLSDPHR